MTLTYLDAKQLHGAIVNGCQCVIAQCDTLNKINIFPVADGDTGSNMSSTARAVIYYSKASSALKETFQSIAEASILGARGNSGMIFSQFFNGLNESFAARNQVGLRDFSELLSDAATSVRKAIATPVDGTMLTIIEAWAESFQQAITRLSCYKDIMQTVLPSLKQSVEDTKEALAALKQSDLVDAGALGFYHFIQGFANYLYNPEGAIKVDSSLEVNELLHIHPHESLSHDDFRYCTEGILRGESIDKDALTAVLSTHGDSAVISGNQTICRFHVHTDKPWTVYSRLIEQGTIEHPKVDDMLRQSQIAHHPKHTIALVTDSCADIPMAFKDEHQIHTLPINIHLDDHHLLDGYSFEPSEFYQSLRSLKSYPKTSLPSAHMVEERLAMLARSYESVIVLSVSKALSGTYDVIQAAAHKHNNIYVVNSKTTTGAQGLLVAYASELIAEGVCANQIIAELNRKAEQTRLFVAIDQFESLIRSGRVSLLKGRIAQFAGIKPIITINDEGKAHIQDKARNNAKALAKLVELTHIFSKQSERLIHKYCIVHAGVEEKARDFSRLTTEAFNQEPAFIENASAAIGLHAGFGAIGLAVMMQ